MEELTYVRVNGGTPSGCMIVIEIPSVEDMGAEKSSTYSRGLSFQVSYSYSRY